MKEKQFFLDTKFKLGDIITGIEESRLAYAITNNCATCKVVGIKNKPKIITVRVLDTTDSDRKCNIGMTFDVNPKYFVHKDHVFKSFIKTPNRRIKEFKQLPDGPYKQHLSSI